MNLSVNDFPQYFTEVHGHKPFKWQCRLLVSVMEQGWSFPIGLPTASGKTAVLDVAVFALALQAQSKDRKTPRRIALVVDRRIVVDDAFERAKRIKNALHHKQDKHGKSSAVLAAMHDALMTLGGEIPLDCAALRGGIYREDRWARTPLQPVILCSTVDQVGSRLLHRGYGLSNFTWPIHAGLLGHDSLIVLDEAHCSQPFLQTLEAIARFRACAIEKLPGPWAFVPMTATPRGDIKPFQLTGEERAEPLIAKRLGASKKAQLLVAKDKGDKGFADAAFERLQSPELVLTGRGQTTLVVCNRVKAARLLHDKLMMASTASGKKAFPCIPILLTGRSRSIERDVILKEYRDRLMAGREREKYTEAVPFIIVATQCVEVGADLDVDVLITEACPIDSLRQRFGRLDRLGERTNSSALILCRPEYVGIASKPELPKEVDPVYGNSLPYTWWWLNANSTEGIIDCGISALDKLLNDNTPKDQLAAPATNAPLIFPAYCDLWVQTGPMPAVSPDPAVFLHGPQSGPPDVGIVWRADLDPDQPETWIDTIAACPPVSAEVLALPFHAARAWLAGNEADPGTDQEGEPQSIKEIEAKNHRQALRWLGPEKSDLIESETIKPGDTIIVPCVYGGADRFGWTGRDIDIPRDKTEAARLAAKRPALLRVVSRVGTQWWGDQLPTGWSNWADRLTNDDQDLPDQSELIKELLPLLPEWLAATSDSAFQATLQQLISDGKKIRISAHPSGSGFIIAGYQRLGEEARDFSDEDDLSSLSKQGTVTLKKHLIDVRDWAKRIAESADLPQILIDALALAGYLHDLGKADPRFQAWLVGGDRLRVRADSLLAKSDMIRGGKANADARERAGYPKGGRHELLSVRMAENAAALLPADDLLRDLVLHLIASHHGRCRPFAPVIHDERPITVQYNHEGTPVAALSNTGLEHIASGITERFWRLIHHYGWWGLSYLEACLRLADHRASEQGMREAKND